MLARLAAHFTSFYHLIFNIYFLPTTNKQCTNNAFLFISFPQIAVRLLYKVRFCFILWKLGLFLSQQTSKQPFSGAYADKLFAVVPIPLMFCLFHIYPLFHLPLILLILLKAKHNNKTRLRYSSSKTFLSFCLLFPFLCTFLYLVSSSLS